MRSSNDVADDHVALRERMRRDGYVLVRGAVDADVVARTGCDVVAALSAGGWIGDDRRPTLPLRHSSLSDPGWRAVLLLPSLNRLPYEPGPQRLMDLIAGRGVFVYPAKVPRVVAPERLDPAHKGRFTHQDYLVIGRQDMFTMWTPLQEITPEMGSLAVLPGSSRLGWARPRRLGVDEANWVTTTFRPGDVLVFHCLTWHAALPNLTDRMRLSVDVRWQLDVDLAPARLIAPPRRAGAMHRTNGGGELFGRVFGRQPWWHPVPAGLVTVDDVAPPVGDLITPSRYVDMPAGQRQPATRANH